MDFDAELSKWPSLSHLMTQGPFYDTPELEVTKKILTKSNTFVSWLVTNVDLSQILDFLVPLV